MLSSMPILDHGNGAIYMVDTIMIHFSTRRVYNNSLLIVFENYIGVSSFLD